MNRCPLNDKCAFYLGTMHKMPLGADHIKKMYCEKSFAKCERFRLADDVYVGEPGNEITPLGRNFSP